MLEAVQRDLLLVLAKAARSSLDGERPFLAVQEMDKTTMDLRHPSLPSENTDAYPGDLQLLAREGYLLLERHPQGYWSFDVTPEGFRAAGLSPAPPRRWGRWFTEDERPYAKSAMSNIWRVTDSTTTERESFALKEMRYDKSRGSAAYRRFVREIIALSESLKNSHPGIVEVIDHALPAVGDESDPFYVMPLAQSSLQRAAKFSLSVASRHVGHSAGSVAAAHTCAA